MDKKVVSSYIVLILIASVYILLDYKYEENKILKKEMRENQYKEIIKNYSDYVRTKNEVYLYEKSNDKYVPVKKISKNFYLELENNVKDYKDTYFKVKNKDYYVYYKDVSASEKSEFNTRYKKFIYWNQSVRVLNSIPVYYEDGSYIYIEENTTYPIIIKDTNKYFIEYDGKIGYINVDENIEVFDQINSKEPIANAVAVLCYHYTYSSANGEYCPNGIICHDEPQVGEQFKYLRDNGYFTPTMAEFEMYLDGKIQLPKKSLVITIDDGWWVPRMSGLLTAYDLNGTLFLIGKLGTYEQHRTPNLEVHSHTYDLHNGSACPGGQGSEIKCFDRQTILNDLAKSRASLNNSTVFCWPFYEYNDYAISLVKEAGFTMAFKGGMYKAKPGINKFLIPRYTIHNTTSLQKFISYIS